MKAPVSFLLAIMVWTTAAHGAIAISGRPVPTMTAFDGIMSNYMQTSGITAGLLGIMRDGRTVYLRGFGNLPTSEPFPENATFRIASLSKPVTAAAIRMLASDGAFGANGIDRKAFNLTVNGTNNGGLLSITPFQSLGDSRMAQITIRHLLDHTSGFDGPDCIFRDGSRQVANDLGLNAPPSRVDRIRWMLHQTLTSTPGTNFVYSNFGFMVLGHIIDTYGGGYINFIRNRVLTAALWVPTADVNHGRTLVGNRLPREPGYTITGNGQSVFDYSPPIDSLPYPYGGEFDLEALLGAGSLVASGHAMLTFANGWHLWYPNAGVPVTQGFPQEGYIHDGGLSGLNTRLQGRGDGVSIYLAFNRVDSVGPPFDSISALIDSGTGFTWPSTTSDGFWVSLPESDPTAGYGGYHSLWQGFGSSLTKASDGTRMRLKPGTSPWTGRITKRIRLDAPEGVARLGVQP